HHRERRDLPAVSGGRPPRSQGSKQAEAPSTGRTTAATGFTCCTVTISAALSTNAANRTLLRTAQMGNVILLLAVATAFCATTSRASAQQVTAAGSDEPTRLLRMPTVSATHIAFMYGNDIWKVGRQGGSATRVTSFPGQELNPHLSPDGQWLAFSAQYGGNMDVFVVPVAGGEPARLTFHPSF